jgi:hypothetical protein
MRDRDPLRQTDPTTRDPVEAYDDPSMILAHGVDAPDPEDPAEPEGLRDAIRDVLAARFTRRSLLSRGAQGLGAAVLASSLPGVFAGPAAARQLDPDGDVKMLNGAIDEGYLQHVTETVVGFGDTEMGWRTGGSPANLQAVDWIAGEMRRVGLRKVAKLPVPIDRWVFNGATVEVDGGPTFDASSWGGVPGTPPGGSHAEVIDIDVGYAANYDGIDATGKIVLVDWEFGDIWVNRHGHQATLEGALAVIFYMGKTAAGAFYNKRDDGLMSFDATYNDDWVPFVVITRSAANDLRDRIAQAPHSSP